jgi:ATP-dependent DNA ligase
MVGACASRQSCIIDGEAVVIDDQGVPDFKICSSATQADASLRNRHQSPSIMGFEDKVEQSHARRCRQT